MLIDDFYHNFDGKVPRPDAVIKIHNVADYAWETLSKLPGAVDVFSLRRPFEKVWFEFILPLDRRKTIGILSVETRLPDNFIRAEDIYVLSNQGGGFGLLGGITTTYDFEGKYQTHDRNRMCFFDRPDGPITEEEAEWCRKWTDQFDGVLNLALNFLHCKNVHIREDPLLAIVVKRRRQEKRDYCEKFYTLNIDPMKRILDQEGEAQTKGLKHALHVCRGHFKTYDDKGLFGKYKGTYFWPAHARGDSTIGRIFKDYSVNPPKKNP